MRVAFCSPEVFPFAKTGGLADVSGSLPFALAEQGCEVKIFTPLYKGIRPDTVNEEFGVTRVGNVEIIFVRHDSYFMRDFLYGMPGRDYPDNLERFSFWGSKVVELFKTLRFYPDIVHCHDWQACPVIIRIKTDESAQAFLRDTRCVLTIHNLAYQGFFRKEKFSLLGIDQRYFSPDFLEFYGGINLLKGGIVLADSVTTVSPSYAEQIQTQEHGCGLEGVLRTKTPSIRGIINGVDYDLWDPAKDPLIYAVYSPDRIQDKQINKRALQREVGLPEDDGTFLLGMVSRLVEQKGVDILVSSMRDIIKDCQLIVLGLGERKYEVQLRKNAKRYRGKFALCLQFDDALAHKIYAGCDGFIMPSRFEPCGLSQLISYKYATVPIAHHTGGLIDTVVDYEHSGGGFVFTSYNNAAFIGACQRARSVLSKQELKQELLKRITDYDFSWDTAAHKYREVYAQCQSFV